MLACLYRLSRQLGKSMDPDELSTIALEAVMDAVQPDVALLFFREAQDLVLKQQLLRDLRADPIDIPLHKVGQCLCGLAVSQGRPLYALDVADDPRCTMRECKAAGVVSFAALPLCHDRGILGVLAMASRTRQRDFSRQAHFLETMTAQIATTLQNAHLHREVQAHSSQLRQTVAELAREIDERKFVEVALRRNAARLESIFRVTPVGLGLVVDRTLLEVNDRVCRMTGRTKEELIGQNARVLYPSTEDYDFVGQEKYRQMGTRGIGTVETRWRHKDGTIIDVLLRSVPLNPDDLSAGVTFSAMDITERKAALNEIRTLNAQLEQRVARRTAELSIKNRELETFSYTVSHDLKAPLRAIDGYSRLLLENHADRLDEEARLFLQYIRNGTTQMGQLIEGLLAYSRLDLHSSGRKTVDLRTVIEQIAAKYREEIEVRDVVVSTDIVDAEVIADARGLALALGNLIDNAFKFTLKSDRPTIIIGGRPSETGFLIWVRDNGKGFDMRYHDRIFDMFQRLDRQEDYPGTGIGLSLVRKAMERMGGRCWAESRPGRGATFFLEIPQ